MMIQQLLAQRFIARAMLPLLLAGAVGAVLVIDLGLRRGLSAAEVSTNMPKDEFERRVHDYLLAHPEVVAEAINSLEARQREQEVTQAQTTLKSKTSEVFRDPNSPVGGNPSGDATVVEFFDYNCPYCHQVASVMIEAEKADPRLRVVYKEFPILGPNSLFAAKAALAADRQSKYVAFHRALYQVRGPIDENKTLEVAKTVGLDVTRLKADMQDPKISAQIDRNIKLARALSINGTPGFAIGETISTGAIDLKSLQSMIATARKAPAANR